MSYVAAFRTHIWDEYTAKLAERFFAACPHAVRKVVLADETRGPLDVPHEKVSHTASSREALGLTAYSAENVLWYCGDYAFYLLVEALPGHDFYIMSENDVAVNVSLEPMMEAAARRSIDIILHEVRPSTPDWAWYENGSAAFAEPWRCYMFFMIASARAARVLLDVRREQAAAFDAGELSEWPYCETFIPSALKAIPGMMFEEVGAFADTSALSFRPRLSDRDPRTRAPGSIAHPVYESSRFIPLLLQDRPAGEYFHEGSELRTGFSHEPFEDIVGPLGRAFLRTRDLAGLGELRREMTRRGVSTPGLADDLALDKPALTSSTSRWSDVQNASLDARGANSGWLLEEAGFHTLEEPGAWWMVDLLDDYVVDRVEILNRPDHPERFLKFQIESSLDGSVWISRYAKIDNLPVSTLVGAPWRRVFMDPFVARFVRIRNLEWRYLHLRQVHVFGRAIASRPALDGPRT